MQACGQLTPKTITASDDVSNKAGPGSPKPGRPWQVAADAPHDARMNQLRCSSSEADSTYDLTPIGEEPSNT